MKRQVAVKSTRGFALKSTHGIAIKSTNMASVDKGESAPVRKNTRQFYDGEESCYIIDAKLEGNLGRYLNVRPLSPPLDAELSHSPQISFNIFYKPTFSCYKLLISKYLKEVAFFQSICYNGEGQTAFFFQLSLSLHSQIQFPRLLLDPVLKPTAQLQPQPVCPECLRGYP